MENANTGNRLGALDGLRGLAITAVLFFHAFNFDFHKKIELLATFNQIFQYGYLGVQLFFMVSGFVIMMTLFKCKSLGEFILRRFARLWPTMLLCSTITFLTVNLLGVEKISFLDFIPSLTLIDFKILNFIFQTDTFNWIDGVYWTLYIEVMFYLIVSIFFFTTKTWFKPVFLIFSVFNCLTYDLLQLAGLTKIANMFAEVLISNHLFYFLIGIGFYLSYSDSRDFYARIYLLTGISLGLLYGISCHDQVSLLALPIITLIFYQALYSNRCNFFSAYWLSSIGMASYSLYLLHARISFSVMKLFSLHTDNQMVILLFIILFSFVMICLAKLIFKYFEQPSNRLILQILVYRDAESKPLSCKREN